jgi:hypothetical protein
MYGQKISVGKKTLKKFKVHFVIAVIMELLVRIKIGYAFPTSVT